MTGLRRALPLVVMLLSGAVDLLAAPAPPPAPSPAAGHTNGLLGVSRARPPEWWARTPTPLSSVLAASIERAVRNAALERGARRAPEHAPSARTSCARRVLIGTAIGGLGGLVLGAISVSASPGPSFISPGRVTLFLGGLGAVVGAGIGAAACL